MADWLEGGVRGLLGSASGFVNELVVAVIIILIGLIIGKVLEKLVGKLLHEFEIDSILKKTARIKFSVEKIVSRFIAFFVYFVAIVIALNQLGLTTTILHMISAAVLIVIVLSIILGIKDFIPNFLAGIKISREGMIKEGDKIKIKGMEGRVEAVELTEIKLVTKQKDTIFIPNSTFLKEEFVKKKR